jgi:subtilisin family serine protease
MRPTSNGSRRAPTGRADSRTVLTAAAILLLALSSRDVLARPRLDPRLSALRYQLSEEAKEGRTPRVIASDATRPLASGTRIVSGPAGPTLGIDCILELGERGREALLRHGITPWTKSGRFVTATLTPEELDIVAGLDEVNRVDLSRVLKPYLDVSRTLTRADQVNAGPGPTFPVTGFTGRSVVIGIIDTGVDLAHGDFKKPNGQTRVSFAWDQISSSGTPPAGFGYGSEWTEAQINNGQAQLFDNNGHGTHVAGIALGDGSATGNGRPAQQYVGIAPEADLIVVKTTFTQSDVLNAIDYVFGRAGSRDAVINLSLGTQDGPHDGTSVFDQAIADKLGPGQARSRTNHRGGGGERVGAGPPRAPDDVAGH